MAKQYRVGFVPRMINRLVASRIRKGKLADNMYLLTTLGRKSGVERTTPVTLAVNGGRRYLVSPYGLVGWVYNIRDSGLAELARGGKVEKISVTELDAETAAPILKQYVGEVRTVRRYFDVGPEDSIDAFAAAAPRHPVFLIND